MLQQIKHYYSNGLPDENIQEAVNIANTENCVVVITYTMFRHDYKLRIPPGATFESVKECLPRSYGL